MMGNDILYSFADCLRTAGLKVEKVLADGLLHRCGTEGKPHGKDGAYKAFIDPPASLWWMNWRTGDEGTWTVKPERDMDAAQRKTLRERIARTKAETEAELERRREAAAKLAFSIWNNANPAENSHPYLQKKEVPAIGLRQTDKGRLIIPVLDTNGKCRSLQFIDGEGNKLFLRGGKTAGGFFSIPAKNAGKTGPLLICEGYATGSSLHLATGYAVLIAFNAGNLETVARTAHYGHAGRAFLHKLTEYDSIRMVQGELVPAISKTVDFLVPAGSDGQVRRVAQRVALCNLAGGFAVKTGILPESFDHLGCTETCFRDWLHARGGTGASEDAAIPATVRLFIEQHGASRFQDLDTQMNTCPNRVGFRRNREDGATYYVLPESFREIVKGYAVERAVRVLRDAGLLVPEDGRLKNALPIYRV